MKKTFLIGVLACSLFSCSSSCIKGSYYFTKGTQSLQRGEYEDARCFLEKSVELDASMARTHTNLALVYIELGEKEKAWLEFRKAYKLEPRDIKYKMNLVNFWNEYKIYLKLQNGTPKNELINFLGLPDADATIQNEEHKTYLLYGAIVICLEDDKYVDEEYSLP